MMNKLISISSAEILVSLSCKKKNQDDRPNVILFLTDDVGYGDVALHGNPYVKTPALSKFAKEGIEFTHFYVAPASSLTRAGILNGMNYISAAMTPSIIFHGTQDTTVPLKYIQQFCKKPDEYGVKYELCTYEGQTHGFFNYKQGDNPYFYRTLKKTEEFLIRYNYIQKE